MAHLCACSIALVLVCDKRRAANVCGTVRVADAFEIEVWISYYDWILKHAVKLDSGAHHIWEWVGGNGDFLAWSGYWPMYIFTTDTNLKLLLILKLPNIMFVFKWQHVQPNSELAKGSLSPSAKPPSYQRHQVCILHYEFYFSIQFN